MTLYGEKMLETPSNSGLGIVAWGVPALAVILGAAGIFVAVRRWSHTPRLAATDEPTKPSSARPQRDRSRKIPRREHE